MTYNQILNNLGLTQTSSEYLIVMGVVTIFVGFLLVMFWQYIVAGAVVFAVLTVFSHQVVTETTKTEEAVVQKDDMNDKESYLIDCKSLTDKSDLCEDLWKEREGIILKGAVEEVVEEIKTVSVKNLLNVDNAEYKERRAQALKKPGAIVMQTTFSDHDR